MLLLWGQITRRKLCFYYPCKFGVISIKYVIKYDIYSEHFTTTYCYHVMYIVKQANKQTKQINSPPHPLQKNKTNKNQNKTKQRKNDNNIIIIKIVFSNIHYMITVSGEMFAIYIVFYHIFYWNNAEFAFFFIFMLLSFFLCFVLFWFLFVLFFWRGWGGELICFVCLFACFVFIIIFNLYYNCAL
jgi:cation transport ATPase